MVVSADPLSSERAEMNILEINQELRSQLAESNQQFRDLKEKFLITQATAYSLANQLKKYKCEEYKDIIDSVLRDELQFMEKLAEKLRQAEELRQYKALVHSQAKELTQLREKLREGRDASRWLNKHLKTLLTPDDPDKSQGQDLREQLAEGHRLAEHLVHKLSPENDEDEDEDEDDKDEEVEKVQESPAPREVQKTEEKEVPQDSLEECAVTCSNSHNPSNSNQPHRSTKITFEEHEVDSALVVESEHPHDEEEEALNILPVLQDLQEKCVLSHSRYHDKSNSYMHREVSFFALDEQKVCSAQDVARDYSNSKWDETPLGFLGRPSYPNRLNRELPEVEEHEVPQEAWDEADSTLPILPNLTGSYQSDMRSALHSLEAQQACVAFDVDKIKKDQEEELPDVKEQEVPEDSVNEVYLTPSVHHDVSDCHQPYSSTLSSLEDQLACSALDVA
uniref:Olduvai domain-containing protein n=1 Tax=Gorilla gorilla gorilla TaxID=9595 RepID=G3RC64_GORGO